MRILFTIPHYVQSAVDATADKGKYGSLIGDFDQRVEALTACLTALHGLFRPVHWIIDHSRRAAHDAPNQTPHQIDIVICTTQGRHILDRLPVGATHYVHHATRAAPELLGFACHDVLLASLGHYDYYCYLEDDIVLPDPWLFIKLHWFCSQAGDDKLLQPNRYEMGLGHPVAKLYVDGDLAENTTRPFQDIQDSAPISLSVMGQTIVCERTLNPHSGCFFLNARQMEQWTRQPHFADRQSRFIGPLETAATLGIMRTFKVYKPTLANADFLEVRHHGSGYLKQLQPIEGGDRP